MFPTVLRKMFKLPMKVVAGYGGAAEIVVAIKRSEVDGRCGWSWSSLVSWNRDMWEGKQIDVVLQLATRRLDELPDVPLITEVTDNPDHRAALRLIVSRQTMARPYVMPPGVPAERLRAMRAAFEATMKDPTFLADAKRQDLEVHPVSGRRSRCAAARSLCDAARAGEARDRVHDELGRLRLPHSPFIPAQAGIQC